MYQLTQTSGIIDKIVSLHDKTGNLVNAIQYKKRNPHQEEMGTTAVGMEVAIPTHKHTTVKLLHLLQLQFPNSWPDYEAPGRTSLTNLFLW